MGGRTAGVLSTGNCKEAQSEEVSWRGLVHWFEGGGWRLGSGFMHAHCHWQCPLVLCLVGAAG